MLVVHFTKKIYFTKNIQEYNNWRFCGIIIN
jgi:hypothetical protein